MKPSKYLCDNKFRFVTIESMSASVELDSFIERIMHVNVLRMGGAAAGIMGAAGGDAVILNKLKRSAIAFAREYCKPTPSPDELTQVSQEMYGYLQTLQLTYTLSEKEADKLMDELQALLDRYTTTHA
jgi:hypothetical protein